LYYVSGGGGATAAVPWKEEGEVPSWSDGPWAQKLSDDKNYFGGRCCTPKKHPSKIQNAPKFEKDLMKIYFLQEKKSHGNTGWGNVVNLAIWQ
jgi:hypothetical protein